MKSSILLPASQTLAAISLLLYGFSNPSRLFYFCAASLFILAQHLKSTKLYLSCLTMVVAVSCFSMPETQTNSKPEILENNTTVEIQEMFDVETEIPSCDFALVGPQFSSIYSDQQFSDPGFKSICECSVSFANNSANDVIISTYSCPGLTEFRITRIRQPPKISYLAHFDNNILISASSPVSLSPKSFKVHGATIEAVLESNFTDRSNEYVVQYTGTAHGSIALIGDCLDLAEPFGNCLSGSAELDSLYSKQFIGWNATIKHDNAFTLQLDLDTSIRDAEFLIEYGKLGKSWWGEKMEKTAASANISALNDTHLIVSFDDISNQEFIYISVQGFGVSSGLPVLQKTLELKLEQGLFASYQGACCLQDSCFKAMHPDQCEGEFNKDASCPCASDEPKIQTFQPKVTYALLGPASVQVYVDQETSDPGVSVSHPFKLMKTSNSAVEIKKKSFTVKQIGEYEISYHITTQHSNHTLKRIIQAANLPALNLISHTSGYKSIIVEFTSPPSSSLAKPTHLTAQNFVLFSKRQDSSQSSCTPRLVSATPVDKSFFGGWSNETKYELVVEFSTEFADGELLYIALDSRTPCFDSVTPFGKCESKPIEIPLKSAPVVVDVRAHHYFGQEAPIGVSIGTNLFYYFRWFYRRVLLSLLGRSKLKNEVIVEVTFSGQVDGVGVESFEASLLGSNTRASAKFTSRMQKKGWFVFVRKLLSTFIPAIGDPSVVYRDGDAVVGTGNLRALNMREQDCGVPVDGVGVDVVDVVQIEPPRIDIEEIEKEKRETIRGLVYGQGIFSAMRLTIRYVLHNVWASAFEFIVGRTAKFKKYSPSL